MGFCELTGVWSSLLHRQRCVGSWCGKRGGPGETAALLSPVSLLTVLKEDPTLWKAETWCCEDWRTNNAGSCNAQKLWARAWSGQQHRLNREEERNGGDFGK